VRVSKGLRSLAVWEELGLSVVSADNCWPSRKIGEDIGDRLAARW
jgi:hypothetical protein